MAEDFRQIYSSTSIICCNDALKGVSVGFDRCTLFSIVLFDLIKGSKCGSLIFRKRVPELLMMPIFSWRHKSFLHKGDQLLLAKTVCFKWGLFYPCRCHVFGHHVLQPFRGRCLIVDIENICLTQ